MIIGISIVGIIILALIILGIFYSPVAMLGTLVLYIVSNVLILMIANITIYYILKIPYQNVKLDRFRQQLLMLYEKIYILNFWRGNDEIQ